MKFLLVYYGGKMAQTPKETEKSMATWMKWFGSMGKALVDAGAPTMPGKVISSAGNKAGTVGEPVTGYSIIKAESLDSAVNMAKNAPLIAEGGKVAVYSLVDLPGM